MSTDPNNVAAQTREGVIPWAPEQYPHDPDGQAGMCHFAPNCGGVPYKVRGEERVSKPDHRTCPNAPAEFSARTGMDTQGVGAGGKSATAGFERFIPLCRARADRQYRRIALERAESGG